MRRFALAIVILIGGFALSNQAHAVVCAMACTEPDASALNASASAEWAWGSTRSSLSSPIWRG
jgi:hypothetical protein